MRVDVIGCIVEDNQNGIGDITIKPGPGYDHDDGNVAIYGSDSSRSPIRVKRSKCLETRPDLQTRSDGH